MTALENRPPVNPMLVLTVGILAVSTGAIFVRLADAPALVTAAYRMLLASAVFVPLAWWKSRDELKSLSRRDLLHCGTAGFFLAVHFAAWIASLDYTSVANSVVYVNTIPIWVGLLAPLVSHERMNRAVVVGIILSISGAFIIGTDKSSGGSNALLGDGLAVIGAIFAALYILYGRNLRQRISLLTYVTVCYGFSAAFLTALVLALGFKMTGFTTTTLFAFAGLALVSQCVGHTTYNWALKYFSAGVISIALLGEPIGGVVLAYLVLGESVSWTQVGGCTLILGGIYHSASSRRKPGSGEQSDEMT